LGIKDFQQLILISRHILKNNIKTQVVPCKTVREKNGIACSTRNLNLNNKQLLIASNIYKHLIYLRKRIKKNYKNFNTNIIVKNLLFLGANKIDYIENIDLKNLKKLKKNKKNFKLFIAYYINDVRLIDNI